jgi:hypothetical protein
MTRNAKNKEIIQVSNPVPLNRDALERLNADQLERLKARYALELSVLSERTETNTTPWEVELCYVERALEKRLASDAITPPEFRN